jgi:hypothetical protein
MQDIKGIENLNTIGTAQDYKPESTIYLNKALNQLLLISMKLVQKKFLEQCFAVNLTYTKSFTIIIIKTISTE